MADIKSEDRWFATSVKDTWCRMGGNGPINVSQLMPLIKFTRDGESFLDVGCGSGTTIDAIDAIKRDVKYKGVDFIDSMVTWLREHYPTREFDVQDARHLKEADRSWDVVWSRHVADHMKSFEGAIDEQCRVANKRVICVLWYGMNDTDEHIIKNIVDGPEGNRKTYEDEYLNEFSRKKVKEYLNNKEGFELIEFRENVTWQGDKDGKGRDTIIVLERI
jgi:SAM-dependent methyltransferase